MNVKKPGFFLNPEIPPCRRPYLFLVCQLCFEVFPVQELCDQASSVRLAHKLSRGLADVDMGNIVFLQGLDAVENCRGGMHAMLLSSSNGQVGDNNKRWFYERG